MDSPRPLTRGGIYFVRLDWAHGAEVAMWLPIAFLTAQRLHQMASIGASTAISIVSDIRNATALGLKVI